MPAGRWCLRSRCWTRPQEVIDGAHTWAGYWVGKNKASILLTAPRRARHGLHRLRRLMYDGGGWELYKSSTAMY